MKLNKESYTVKDNLGGETIEATIDESNISKLYDLLDNAYKNPIGSIVREITSNCFDSHKEAGVDDPVMIKLDSSDTGYSITFSDVGVGLSPERINKIYLKYLSTTKDQSDDFLGAFGLGSKSPFSYTPYFNIVTRFNGTEYHYMLRKSVESKTQLTELTQFKTTERNGTDVIIQIKNKQDLDKFITECKNQLYYFENVVIDYSGIKHLYYKSWQGGKYTNLPEDNLNQNFKLVKGKNFVFRIEEDNSYYENGLHLCLGTVKYPIDWENLNMPKINVPFALKFDIGELTVMSHREDIKYTEANILAIKSKIEDVKAEITELYNKQNVNFKDVFEFVNFLNNFSNKLEIEGIALTIPKELLDRNNINPYTYKDISLNDAYDVSKLSSIANKVCVNVKLEDAKEYKNGRMLSRSNAYLHGRSVGGEKSINSLSDAIFHIKNVNTKFYACHKSLDTNYNSIKNKYIDSDGFGKEVDFFYKNIRIGLARGSYNKSKLKEVLRLDNKNTKLLTKYIIKESISFFKNRIINYDTIKVPDDFEVGKGEGIDRSLVNVNKLEVGDRYDYSISSYLSVFRKFDRISIGELYEDHLHNKKALLLSATEAKNIDLTGFHYLINFLNKKMSAHWEIYSIADSYYNKAIEVHPSIITYKKFIEHKKMNYKILPKIVSLNKVLEKYPNFSKYISNLPNEDFVLFSGNYRTFHFEYSEIYTLNTKIKNLAEEELFKVVLTNVKEDVDFTNKLESIVDLYKNGLMALDSNNYDSNYPYILLLNKPLLNYFYSSSIDTKNFINLEVLKEPDIEEILRLRLFPTYTEEELKKVIWTEEFYQYLDEYFLTRNEIYSTLNRYRNNNDKQIAYQVLNKYLNYKYKK